MILANTLGDTSAPMPTDDPAMNATLDDLFRRALARRPDAPALIDPPDRSSFTDGPVRRLSYAQADRAISVLAARLRAFGLPTDAVVAIQLPNTVESVIALLAVMRAGLIAAPLPLLWRHADAAAALSRVAARALIGCQRVGDVVHGDLAMHIAAETFTIRFLCGFGENLPDGVVALDDIFESDEEPPEVERQGAPADHVALLTFDITADGIVPVARSHAELVAAGLAVHLEARTQPDAVFLGAIAAASFASLAGMILPWLLCAGTLVLHHPFAPAVFARQRSEENCAVAVLPGPMVMRLAEAGLIARENRAGGLARARTAARERALDRQRGADRHSGVRRDRPDGGAARRGRQARRRCRPAVSWRRAAPTAASTCSMFRACRTAPSRSPARWCRMPRSRPAPNAAARPSSR